MAKLAGAVLLLLAAASAAPPAPVEDTQGPTRYNPDLQNVYHLFTRENPNLSQPFLQGRNDQLVATNFNPYRRTVFIIHGWTQSVNSDLYGVIINSYMKHMDCNFVAVDWSAGASIFDLDGPVNGVASGHSVAKTINWIMETTGASVDNIHIIGFSLGAHVAAVAARGTKGTVPYLTGLDPGANMEDSGHMFGPDAAAYTEAIHTNADIMGHGPALAHVDFYPNGGDYQPGCGVINFLCNHYRSYFFFAETLEGSSGFIGARCQSYAQARLGLCTSLTGTLRMGGLYPKTGSTGMFHLTTNAEPPFSQ